MSNHNRLATGLAIAFIAASASTGEASASTGGMAPGHNPNASGGLPAGYNPNSTGGVSVDMPSDSTPLAQRLKIERHIQSGKSLKADVLKTKNEKAQIYVTDTKSGELMINPLVIEFGGKMVSFLARTEDGVATMPADRAEVSEWVGQHNFPIEDPATLVETDTLRPVTETSVGAKGFEDSSGQAFGITPSSH